jgi:5-methyltetrahydrofolate--homocysteine methyltransferase
MLIVGEKINTSRSRIAKAVEERDAAFITRVAREQARAGADYIDVNAGTFLEREAECLCWLVQTVQAEVDLPLCLDSPNPEAIRKAMEIHRGQPMVNSISLEPDRFQSLLPVVKERPCRLVALCMASTSMPESAGERLEVAGELVSRLLDAGLTPGDIYVDPLVQPVSVDTRAGTAALEAIRLITDKLPGVNTICGLSNASFGLPRRRLVNRNFLALSMIQGLGAAILDPTDRRLMATVLAVDMLLGRDEFCSDFLEGYQNGQLPDE